MSFLPNEIPTSPVGSPADPRSLDRQSLDKLEEVSKQLLEGLGMSTPDIFPDRALKNIPN